MAHKDSSNLVRETAMIIPWVLMVTLSTFRDVTASASRADVQTVLENVRVRELDRRICPSFSCVDRRSSVYTILVHVSPL